MTNSRTALFGIPNCTTIRRARAWLDHHNPDYVFHDYRKSGVPDGILEAWCDRLGWEALLNRSGTTFRNLPENEKGPLDVNAALTLMRRQPSMIRRPVLVHLARIEIGFTPERYAAFLT